MSYLTPRGVEVQSGFKLSYAAAFKQAGDFVTWIGDGDGDVGAARASEAVFGRSHLWEALKDEHRRIYPFETFQDVVAVLEREGAGWLEGFGEP